MTLEPTHPYTVLDVFTDAPLHGNPLAVFTAGEEIPSRLMQAAARELNLSETVFLLPGEDDCDAYARIFTPATELPFAGHPTLGAAWLLAMQTGHSTVRLGTGAGIVPVHLTWVGDEIVAGEMEQPVPSWTAFESSEPLFAALGVERSTLPVEVYSNGPSHVMVGIGSVDELAGLRPDMAALSALGPYTFACFADPTPSANPPRRVRVFCPELGVPEDPATGSAAGPLGVHLLRHGRTASGETIELLQGVEIGRPSTIRVRVERSADAIASVVVGGSAVVVATGHFRLG